MPFQGSPQMAQVQGMGGGGGFGDKIARLQAMSPEEREDMITQLAMSELIPPELQQVQEMLAMMSQNPMGPAAPPAAPPMPMPAQAQTAPPPQVMPPQAPAPIAHAPAAGMNPYLAR